jgi:hypothetical protein
VAADTEERVSREGLPNVADSTIFSIQIGKYLLQDPFLEWDIGGTRSGDDWKS